MCTQVISPWKRCWARDVSVKSGVGGFLVAVIVTSIGGVVLSTTCFFIRMVVHVWYIYVYIIYLHEWLIFTVKCR